MRRIPSLLFSVLALSLIAVAARATVLSNGVDTARPTTQPTRTFRATAACNVLWYEPRAASGPEDQRMSTLGFNTTFTNNPSDLTAANLANYRILVVAATGPGSIGAAQADIESFVRAGGGLLIHQPNNAGALDYAPTGFGVTIVDPYWCGFPAGHIGQIVITGHPITSGLTDPDLSGPFDYVGSLGSGYSVLAVNSLPTCLDPLLAAGTLDLGNVVFEDGNAFLGSLAPGSDQYWTNVLQWLCSGAATPTHTETWGKLKSIYR